MTEHTREGMWSAADPDGGAGRPRNRFTFRLVLVAFVLSAGTAIVFLAVVAERQRKATVRKEREENPRFIERGAITNWWDTVPDTIVSATRHADDVSNIRPFDYAGHETCRECHRENHDAWSRHPHRWMNAMANVSTVKGDFSGDRSIHYRGGTARFFTADGQYRMRLEREGIRRVYGVTQTIGSRFYQYYIGKGIEGPEPAGHDFYSVDHVLPFGYWLDEHEWVPTVHVHWARKGGERRDEEDLPSDRRPDPFDPPGPDFAFTPYYRCNQCHTTFALGDLLIRYPDVLGRHAPAPLHFAMSDYLAEAHPEVWSDRRHPSEITDEQLDELVAGIWKWEAPDRAVSLGITCEACHLGSRQHAEKKSRKPGFFPASPHLHAEVGSRLDLGRTHANVNYICGRCHAGDRRLLAGGMATWNSTEYTDAMRGSCYTQMRCVDCHNPHRATGRKWSQAPAEDDQKCLKCHQQYEPPSARQAHTHHPAGSEGSRCMNCHMPRLNEGLQDVVRTHMIFSPTQRNMLAANQPNACNMCHTEESINWTLGYLKDWYGAKYTKHVTATYADPEGSAALGWLDSRDQSVRLLAVDALARTKAEWALPQMVDALDDPYLLNRQFARRALEQMLDVRLEDFGYRYYMTAAERKRPLAAVRAALLENGGTTASDPVDGSKE